MTGTPKYYYPAVFWTIFILVICNINMHSVPGEGLFFKGFDKIVHLGLFFVLSIFIFFGDLKQQSTGSSRFLIHVQVLLIAGILGGGVELLQWKVFTWRGAEWADFFCDMLGASMAVFSFIVLNQLQKREKES